MGSYKTIHNKKDPVLSLAVEKIKPLLEGLNLYKRYNNLFKKEKY